MLLHVLNYSISTHIYRKANALNMLITFLNEPYVLNPFSLPRLLNRFYECVTFWRYIIGFVIEKLFFDDGFSSEKIATIEIYNEPENNNYYCAFLY